MACLISVKKKNQQLLNTDPSCFSSIAGWSYGQQQFFRVLPTDVHVGEGGVAVIQCAVENRAGRVQWTKDGLTLGKNDSYLGQSIEVGT